MHWAVAPAGFLFSAALVECEAAGAAAAGFGAGATVVLGPDETLLVRQTGRVRLNHLVQSVVVEVVLVVVLTAPGALPEGVCTPAVRQAVLFALPAFVQSYCRVVVVVFVAVVVVRDGLAAAGAGAAAPLHAALLALPGFEQS